MLTWTGTEYGMDNVFDLTKMEPYNMEMLHKSFTKYSNEVVLYLPRNSDLNQIARYAKDGQKLEVAHYAIMGASKVSCILRTVHDVTDLV
jgi:trimethylguanosine synthase